MDENLGSTVAWCLEGTDNSCSADGAIASLNSQTVGWTDLTKAGGSVSLPSGQDIADAIGDSGWTDSVYTGEYGPSWIGVNLEEGKVQGYWTSTAFADNSICAWYVNYFCELSYGEDVSHDESYGIRPVITISKTNMSL